MPFQITDLCLVKTVDRRLGVLSEAVERAPEV